MAKIPGGITSRPSGKVGNIVFGAARTPEGKVATARQLVSPSNPDTPAQQAQRSKFQDALATTQNIGPDVYQDDWNRAVGQLPGFQSWMAVLLRNIDGSDVLQPPPDRPLGNLHYPDSVGMAVGTVSSAIEVAPSSETGANGTASDELVIVAIEEDLPANRERDVTVSIGDTTRGGGPYDLVVGQADTDYTVLVYLRGAGSADGLLSLARSYSQKSEA